MSMLVHMWNKKVEVIPVIMGATGIVDKEMLSKVSVLRSAVLWTIE